MRKPRVLPLLLAVWMLCLTIFPAAAADSVTAATMQLMKTEGTVNVTNASGRSLAKRDNMLLYNGYHVETKAKSYAWINLDSSKLIKLDAVSEAEVRKSGKSLELLLSSGGFFFNVTSPVKEEETMNIRTATMVVGIRGTSGWFKAVDRWSTEIYVLEGTVQCSVSDPVTGQAKEATIQSGEMAVATAYPQDYAGDKCDIVQEKFEPGDIDGFVLEELALDPELCADIFEKSGLDVISAVEATQERREQDEQKMQDALDRIGEQQAEQDSSTSPGSVWGQEDPAPNRPDSSTGNDDNGGGDQNDSDGRDDSGGAPDTPSPPQPVMLTMPLSSPAELQAALDEAQRTGAGGVLLEKSGDETKNTLTISNTKLTIPAGMTLGIDEAIGVTIESDAELAVYGVLYTGELTNHGTITNAGTIHATGLIGNAVVDSGKLEIAGSTEEAGFGRAGGKVPETLALCLIMGLSPEVFAVGCPFTDVPDAAWYSGAVQYVYAHGMMGGSGSAATFAPDSPTSRGMLATVLHRMEGLPSADRAAFADVPSGQWYADAVAWASAHGIIAGYGNGNFGPNDPITREQLASILYRYAGYKGYPVTVSGDAAAFPDGDTVSSYAVDAVNWAVETGLIQGSGDMLSPTGGATRAQAAAILMRFCENVAPTYTLTVVSAMDVMCEPRGILALEDGSFLVTDSYNKVIWLVADSASTVYAGSDTVADPYGKPLGGYHDAALEDALFKRPWAIAPFLGGYAVSDADNNVVRLLLEETTQTVNGVTEEDLTVTDLGVIFNHPTGLASDEEGNLYVSDTYEGAVRKITPEGNVTTFAEGLTDPMGLCWKDGTLYIAETGANRIVKITDGQTVVVAGSGEDDLSDGPAAQAAFSAPQCVAVGEDGTVYVSDTANSAIRKIHDGVVTTLVRRDESDLDAVIPVSPVGLMLHGDRLYVCDSFARKVFVISREQ